MVAFGTVLSLRNTMVVAWPCSQHGNGFTHCVFPCLTTNTNTASLAGVVSSTTMLAIVCSCLVCRFTHSICQESELRILGQIVDDSTVWLVLTSMIRHRPKLVDLVGCRPFVHVSLALRKHRDGLSNHAKKEVYSKHSCPKPTC